MRFAIRGRTTPRSLAPTLLEISERLDKLGVESISGISIYLRAFVEDQEMRLLLEDGTEVDLIETWLNASSGNAERSTRPEVFIVRPIDLSRATLFIFLAQNLRIPWQQICALMGIGEDALVALKNGKLKFEFDAETRARVTALGTMTEKARDLFPSMTEILKWFNGPHLHSKLSGETPRQQLLIGGVPAAIEITDALESFLKRKRFGGPNLHSNTGYYDLIHDSGNGVQE